MPPSPDVDEPAWLDLARRAGERAGESYPKADALIDADSELVHREVALLLDKLRDAVRGRPPTSIEIGPLDRVTLLDRLRGEFVRSWSGEDADLLVVVRGLEDVRDALLSGLRGGPRSSQLTPFARKLLREVAHMLRSPLGSIVMLADALLDERLGPLTEAQARQVAIMHRAAFNMAATAGDILTLISDEDRVERIEHFSVGEALHTVAGIVGPVAEARERELVVDCEDGVTRWGPASALREILLGLALRATLAAREGEVRLVASPEENDAVRFLVASRSGPAGEEATSHPADVLDLFRVDRETGDYSLSPLGIGVAATRDMLSTLGATLDVEGASGSELRFAFRLELPRWEAEEP